MFKIEGWVYGELDVKRCYLPQLKMTHNCPKCQKELVFDGDRDYLSNPSVGGKPVLVVFYCEACDEQVLEKVRLELTVSKA